MDKANEAQLKICYEKNQEMCMSHFRELRFISHSYGIFSDEFLLFIGKTVGRYHTSQVLEDSSFPLTLPCIVIVIPKQT